MPTRAAIYLRESTLEGAKDDRYGIPVQWDHTLAYCHDHGYEVYDTYVDKGEDSAELDRPELNRLRHDMADGCFQVIVVDASDRLAREGWLTRLLLSEAKVLYRVRVDSTRPDQQWDLDTMEGQILASVQWASDQKERENIRRRTQGGRKKRAQLGNIIPGPKPPYGYAWTGPTKNNLTDDPATFSIMRRICDETLAGRTPAEIQDDLDRDGIPTPRLQP
jgi:site-specific DNA recombinase